MENKVLGLHHITAIAANAQGNYDFYTKVLGLRLIKKTVNFDDPKTYHFYFGDEIGSPGSILTFFPWEGVVQGRIGPGMATQIGYSVPRGSLGFWADRFERFKVNQEKLSERFGEQVLTFKDPDGLNIQFIIPKMEDNRKPWESQEVKSEVAARGFHSIVLTLKTISPTANILTDILGYRLLSQEGNQFRFITNASEQAAIVDLIELPAGMVGHIASGTIHHVAFRVKDENVLMEYHDRIASKGINITPKINRDYFFSLYFREPGGVLFELATENPGFATDETVAELGSSLKLPKQYEPLRSELTKVLPKLIM